MPQSLCGVAESCAPISGHSGKPLPLFKFAEASDRISTQAASHRTERRLRDATKSVGCADCNYYEWLKTRLPCLHPMHRIN